MMTQSERIRMDKGKETRRSGSEGNSKAGKRKRMIKRTNSLNLPKEKKNTRRQIAETRIELIVVKTLLKIIKKRAPLIVGEM